MKFKPLTINQTITFIYSVVAAIYFLNAYYSHVNKIEGEVYVNIGLGFMFLCLGIVCRMPNKEK